MKYFDKMKGLSKSPPAVGFSEIIWSWIGAFIGIGAVSYINYNIIDKNRPYTDDRIFRCIGGADIRRNQKPAGSARNFMGGHIISAIIGVACFKIFSSEMWLASSLAVATAIVAMHATKTLHPPGGATALIAVTGSDKIHSLGYLYVLIPVGLGALIMLAVALLVNNLPKSRRYPEFWM